MSDLIFKANIEFEDSDQAREMVSLLLVDDDESEEQLKAALDKFGEISYQKKSAMMSEVLNAPRKNKKGTFTIRDATQKGDAVWIHLEGAGDAAWLMGIVLVMMAEEMGGALQDGTLKDPNKNKLYDLIYNGEVAKYEETVDADEEDEDEDEDDEYGFDDDFDEDFRDEDF